jgi:hypothetical protein
MRFEVHHNRRRIIFAPRPIAVSASAFHDDAQSTDEC